MGNLDSADIKAVLLGDKDIAQTFLRLISHPADIVESIRTVPIEKWPDLFALLEDEDIRAEVAALLDEHEWEQFANIMPSDRIGALLQEMDSDDAADIIGDLKPQKKLEALSHLEDQERKAVEILLKYPEDSAGGIMQVERFDLRYDATIQNAIEAIQKVDEDDFPEIHRIYIVDSDKKLLGSILPIELLRHTPETALSEILEQPLATVTPEVDQEIVAELFKKYDLIVLPVVSQKGVLLGRIVIDDIVDVLAEEAQEDALLAAGTDKEELLYKDQPVKIAMIRLPWIGINLFGSILVTFITSLYHEVLQEAVVVTIFMTMIAAMGGNVGTQSATILTRGFATGRVHFSELAKIAFRELRVGLLMGVLCGAVVSIYASFFVVGGSVYLGGVLFIALMVAMSTAAVVGVIAPATMIRFGIDPAIASGPFVTTANDITGIIIYLSTALFFLEHLKT